MLSPIVRLTKTTPEKQTFPDLSGSTREAQISARMSRNLKIEFEKLCQRKEARPNEMLHFMIQREVRLHNNMSDITLEDVKAMSMQKKAPRRGRK